MTIEINLLPWRERVRERHRKRFFILLSLSAALGLMAGVIVTYHYDRQLAAQQQRNTHIREETAQLDAHIRSIGEYESLREQMLDRVDIFTRLQQGRAQTVDLFNQLAAGLEDGVHYTRLTRQGESLRLMGVAENNRQVSDQLRALAEAPSFEVPVLSEVESEGDSRQRRFSLSVRQRTSDDALAEASP
ncbi:PilN domain-containing protein [Litchfieldella xinjiangensis]|uniref:PilN domain-containing protein n=1 Tax=Litchfieldella xinjiangensis TaxID=1166948 RepID=UPI0005B80F71|nr:PilN domain-containing protein [Halomonas xinjiangensis]